MLSAGCRDVFVLQRDDLLGEFGFRPVVVLGGHGTDHLDVHPHAFHVVEPHGEARQCRHGVRHHDLVVVLDGL